MELRPAGRANAEGFRRNKLDGERQAGAGLVLLFGEFVGGHRFEHRQHVVESLAREKLRPLVGDFAGVRGRVELGDMVRQIIGVGEIPEIPAHIHRFIEQRGRRLAREDETAGPK